MPAANRITGKDLYVKFNTQVLSGDYTSFGWSNPADIVDLTAGSETFHYKVPTTTDTTGDIEAYFDGTTEPVWDAVLPTTVGSLEVGPSGTATGKLKYSWARVIISGRDPTIAFGDGVKFKVSWEGSSAMVESTY